MGLTSTLFAGLSGLNANSQLIAVTGNNIANVNTVAYKATRLDFETQISQQISAGSSPTGDSGGTNPSQVGLGVQVGSTSRNFTTGSFQPTGVNTNMAIEGSGFFILEQAGAIKYTRDGTFKLDRDFNLVSGNGGLVQGNSVDSNFDIVPGVMTNINIPLGTLTLAQATRKVQMAGNLNSGGDAATVGTLYQSNELHDTASSAAGANDATAATALASLYATGSATALFTTGDVITITSATKGGATLPDHTFEVGATNTTGSDAIGTTLQDFMDFLQGVMGIDTGVGGGEGLAVTAGQLTITGNTGSVNDFTLDSGSIVKNIGASPSLPFTMTKSQTADGESTRTTFAAFDSLGTPLTIDLSIVLEQKTASGTVWRFFTQSEHDSDASRVLGNGTIQFDTNGQFVQANNATFTIDRNGTGAITPQQILLSFQNEKGSVSSLVDEQSRIASQSQDGSPIGTLQDFHVNSNGEIVGVFSNSLLRTLGRVSIATFTNPQGLIDNGNNLFSESVNSGSAQVVVPGSGGSGSIIGSTLELSNVDLSNEFINLVAASTGFSAASRILTTSDRLMQDLLSALR